MTGDGRRAESAFSDWKANSDPKIRCVLVLYRLCGRLWRRGGILRVFGVPLFVLYRVVVQWILCIDLDWRVEAGSPLRIFHGFGLVVHPATTLGPGCTLRHCTTIGSTSGRRVPRIGRNVDIGCNAVVIGDVSVGDFARIGAGAVVVNSLPAGAVAAGNPAKVLRTTSGDEGDLLAVSVSQDGQEPPAAIKAGAASERVAVSEPRSDRDTRAGRDKDKVD